jgi:hypothetical protein
LYRVLVGEHEDHLEELGVRWENNINAVLQGIGWERVDWVYLAEDRGSGSVL